MLEEHTFGRRMAHALDHRGVVHGVREENTTGKFGTKGRQSSIVGDIAGRENESSILSVEIGKLLFEGQMHGAISGNVASAASTVTVFVESAAR